MVKYLQDTVFRKKYKEFIDLGEEANSIPPEITETNLIPDEVIVDEESETLDI